MLRNRLQTGIFVKKKEISNQCLNLNNLKAIQTSCNMRSVQDVNAPKAKNKYFVNGIMS